MQHYEETIELFKMILERSQLCRVAFNAMQRYRYSSRSEYSTKDSILRDLYFMKLNTEPGEVDLDLAIKKRRDRLGVKTFDFSATRERLIFLCNAKEAVSEFTDKTHKRRIELMVLLKTRQYKYCDNVIRHVKLGDKIYTAKEMKKIVECYDVDKILMGE